MLSGEGARRRRASRYALDHREQSRRVRCTQREAVHRRRVEGRQVDARFDVGGRHPPGRVLKGHLFRGKANNAFEDPTLSLFERQELGHYVHKLLG